MGLDAIQPIVVGVGECCQKRPKSINLISFYGQDHIFSSVQPKSLSHSENLNLFLIQKIQVFSYE